MAIFNHIVSQEESLVPNEVPKAAFVSTEAVTPPNVAAPPNAPPIQPCPYPPPLWNTCSNMYPPYGHHSHLM